MVVVVVVEVSEDVVGDVSVVVVVEVSDGTTNSEVTGRREVVVRVVVDFDVFEDVDA
ncbi:hypothetical protein MALV_30470 [Mycolicibacterium alvei]|uniref:Uncharacterized protein n=1 Tax=Mycolicibacterium alvei TaxID=67081 RepID=A0A6N4UWW4_9MYCO|nr:hypothetical protein MALV_30470 [Mycolicibacterium alvei]